MESNFLDISAWKEWLDKVKLELWSHPHADELPVRARMKQCDGVSPEIKFNKQPTAEARNFKAILDTLTWR